MIYTLTDFGFRMGMRYIDTDTILWPQDKPLKNGNSDFFHAQYNRNQTKLTRWLRKDIDKV